MMEKRKSKRSRIGRIRTWIQSRRISRRRLSMMKKPSFWGLFARYLAVGLCAAFLIGYAGTRIAAAYYGVAGLRDFGDFTARTGEYIARGYTKSEQIASSPEAAMSLWKAQARVYLNSLRMVGYEACLYDVRTKERFVEQKCVVHVSIGEKPEDGEPILRAFECEWDEMQEAMADYKKLQEECEPENRRDDIEEWPEFELEDIYIKGGTFIPGKMRLVVANRNGTTELIREYDYTPEKKEGYQYVDCKPNDIYDVSYLYWEMEPTDVVDYEKIDECVKREGYRKSFWTEWSSGGSESKWSTEAFWKEPITLDNGEQYLLVVAADFNLWKDFKEYVLAAYGGLFLFTLLAALAIAYRNYIKRLGYYQLDAYRRETTNAMAHDLKTPLMAISGYAENLRENVHTEKKDRYADLIVEHVEYMNQMVEKILELAKVESIGRLTEKNPVDLNTLTEAVLKKYEILMTDKNLQVKVEGVCVVEADKAYMEQAAENLIGNAIKYAPEDTEIQIRMEKEGYEIRNRINGQLQTPANRLWEPFVKGDDSRNMQKGTGIGLTIVKNIADMHGFELKLKCEEGEFVAKLIF